MLIYLHPPCLAQKEMKAAMEKKTCYSVLLTAAHDQKGKQSTRQLALQSHGDLEYNLFYDQDKTVQHILNQLREQRNVARFWSWLIQQL